MEPEQSHYVGTPPAGEDAGKPPEMDGAAAQPGEPRGARITKGPASGGAPGGAATSQVERSAWLRDDDYWRTVTYMAATGRRPSARSASRPLSPPERFRSPSPLRSVVVLILVIALIILISVGVIIAGNVAAAHITIPTNIPGVTLPTATPASHATATPVATPKKK